MLYKSLCIYLWICCVIGCTTQSTSDEEVDSIFPTPPTITQDDSTPGLSATQIQNLPENQENQDELAECLPDFHGEYISGELDKSNSDYRRKHINQKLFAYYYTLALRIDDATRIQILLPEAAPAQTPDLGVVISPEDILLVKLIRLSEPGIWEGVLVKNLTTNFSFDE